MLGFLSREEMLAVMASQAFRKPTTAPARPTSDRNHRWLAGRRCTPNRQWPAILYKCMVYPWPPSARQHGRRLAGMPSRPVLPPPSRAHHPVPDHPAAPGDLPQAGTRRRLGRSACPPTWNGNFATTSNAASWPTASPGPAVPNCSHTGRA